MLTPREAFKAGFLTRCASDGMTPEQMLGAVKLAAEMFEKRAVVGTVVGQGIDAAKGLAGGLLRMGVPLAIAAPPILGGLGGYALAKATDIDDTDVEAIKNRELVDEYERQTEGLARRRAVRDRRQDIQRPGRALI